MNGPLTARTARGFTMIELVVVIVVLGILATMAYQSGTSPLTSSRRAHANTLASHIRYAQSRSMKTGQTHGISCDGAAYWLFVGDDATVPTALPGETAATVTLASRSITLTAFTVAFDMAGRPYSDAPLTTELPASLTLTLAAADDATESVSLTLYKETGFIQ